MATIASKPSQSTRNEPIPGPVTITYPVDAAPNPQQITCAVYLLDGNGQLRNRGATVQLHDGSTTGKMVQRANSSKSDWVFTFNRMRVTAAGTYRLRFHIYDFDGIEHKDYARIDSDQFTVV